MQALFCHKLSSFNPPCNFAFPPQPTHTPNEDGLSSCPILGSRRRTDAPRKLHVPHLCYTCARRHCVVPLAGLLKSPNVVPHCIKRVPAVRAAGLGAAAPCRRVLEGGGVHLRPLRLRVRLPQPLTAL